MGAGSAIHICDEELRGADLGLTAETLAAAIRRTGFDLVHCRQRLHRWIRRYDSRDACELLDVPLASGLSSVEIHDGAVSGTRGVESGVQQVSADLPAVISITEALPGPRFPNFKGIMAAKKKPLEVLTLADLGITADDPTRRGRSCWTIAEKPPRAAGVKIVDEGDAGEKLAEFLIENRLA